MIQRIRERRDFDRLAAESVRSAGRYVWIRHVPDPRCDPPRVAYAIGRNHGSAVRRNRIRRRLRAAMSSPGCYPCAGLYLVGWRGKRTEPAFSELVEDLSTVCSRFSNTHNV